MCFRRRSRGVKVRNPGASDLSRHLCCVTDCIIYTIPPYFRVSLITTNDDYKYSRNTTSGGCEYANSCLVNKLAMPRRGLHAPTVTQRYLSMPFLEAQNASYGPRHCFDRASRADGCTQSYKYIHPTL